MSRMSQQEKVVKNESKIKHTNRDKSKDERGHKIPECGVSFVVDFFSVFWVVLTLLSKTHFLFLVIG